jgi:hypothetical protein
MDTVSCNFDAHSIGTGVSRDDHIATVFTIIEADGSQRVEYLYDPTLPLHSFSVFQSLL